MKVLADTSCWIEAFRNQESFEYSVIERLIREDIIVTSSLIVAELLRGAKGNRELKFIREEFLEIPMVKGIDSIGVKIGQLGFKLKSKGYTIATLDLALSVLAMENEVFIYTLDHHFEMIAEQSPLKLLKPLKH